MIFGPESGQVQIRDPSAEATLEVPEPSYEDVVESDLVDLGEIPMEELVDLSIPLRPGELEGGAKDGEDLDQPPVPSSTDLFSRSDLFGPAPLGADSSEFSGVAPHNPTANTGSASSNSGAQPGCFAICSNFASGPGDGMPAGSAATPDANPQDDRGAEEVDEDDITMGSREDDVHAVETEFGFGNVTEENVKRKKMATRAAEIQ